MDIEAFKGYWAWPHRMTVDFVNVVPEDKWEFTPAERFGPFSRQLRHVVCVRGVYNEALATGKADFSRIREHYSGPLTREALLTALNEKQQAFMNALNTFDTSKTIDFSGAAFEFDVFLCEVVQHESIHHGQWSVYAAAGGFATPKSWQSGWKL